MNVLFGILLLIVTLTYTIRVFAWFWIYFNLMRKKTRFKTIRNILKNGQKVNVYIWGGIEHGFNYLTLISTSIYLLFYI